MIINSFGDEYDVELSIGRILADVSEMISLRASFFCPQCFTNGPPISALKQTGGLASKLSIHGTKYLVQTWKQLGLVIEKGGKLSK